MVAAAVGVVVVVVAVVVISCCWNFRALGFGRLYSSLMRSPLV